MKKPTFIFALLLSVSAIGIAVAASAPEGTASSEAQPQSAPTSAREGQDGRAVRLAEGFFDNLWGGARHGEHERQSDDDDDDRGGAANPADPNSSNASVPDNGVFAGKARPKVEVQ